MKLQVLHQPLELHLQEIWLLTTTSGPGLALKGEAIGLAMMTELPLVVVNVQRGGPSTGLPTKTEQSDLLQAMYGRNGESPCNCNCSKYTFKLF